MSDDLYQVPSGGAEFTRYCGGNLQSENESCVELARIPGTDSAFILRDTKPGSAGTALRFTGDELDNFVRGYAAERGLTL
jgi:hypothetical protein